MSNDHFDKDKTLVVDFIGVLIRGRRLISVIVLLFAFVSLFFNLLIKRVYKIDSILEIGMIVKDKDSDFLENPSQIIKKVGSRKYDSEVSKSLDLQMRDFRVTAKNSEGTNLIKLEINSSDPDQALLVVGEVGKLIVSEHQKLFQSRINSLQDGVLEIERKLRLIENKSGMYTDSAISELLLELISRRDHISNSYPSTIVKTPAISSTPVGFRLWLNLLFSIFAGLLCGIFIALFREWWEREKQNK